MFWLILLCLQHALLCYYCGNSLNVVICTNRLSLISQVLCRSLLVSSSFCSTIAVTPKMYLILHCSANLKKRNILLRLVMCKMDYKYPSLLNTHWNILVFIHQWLFWYWRLLYSELKLTMSCYWRGIIQATSVTSQALYKYHGIIVLSLEFACHTGKCILIIL